MVEKQRQRFPSLRAYDAQREEWMGGGVHGGRGAGRKEKAGDLKGMWTETGQERQNGIRAGLPTSLPTRGL